MDANDVPRHGAMCAVCAHALDFNGATGQHQHAAYERMNEDHPPVPVRPESLAEIAARCDLCGGMESVRWSLPATDFMMPLILPGQLQARMSVGDWASCTDCAQLVAADAWDKIHAKAVRSHGLENDVIAETWLTMLHQELRRHVTGPPRKEGTLPE